MESAFWEQVAADGHRVPPDRPLAELTTELTSMLGDTDPYIREDIAFGTLGDLDRRGRLRRAARGAG